MHRERSRLGASAASQYMCTSLAYAVSTVLLLTAYGAALLLAPRDEPPLPLPLGFLDDSFSCLAKSSSDLSSNEDAMLAYLLCLLLLDWRFVRSEGQHSQKTESRCKWVADGEPLNSLSSLFKLVMYVISAIAM